MRHCAVKRGELQPPSLCHEINHSLFILSIRSSLRPLPHVGCSNCRRTAQLRMDVDRLHGEDRSKHVASPSSTHPPPSSPYIPVHHCGTYSFKHLPPNSTDQYASEIGFIFLLGYITWRLIHFRRCSTPSCQCHVARWDEWMEQT